jgi:CRP-like cAMP-binding protein
MAIESIDVLRKMPIFGGIQEASLSLLIGRAEEITAEAGDYFFREGDEGGSLFVLRSGSVSVERVCEGETVVLGRLGAGDCFGEMALVDFCPRSASVRASEACTALKIPITAIRALYQASVEQYAMIMMNMGREVSRRLRRADDRLLRLSRQRSTREREPH